MVAKKATTAVFSPALVAGPSGPALDQAAALLSQWLGEAPLVREGEDLAKSISAAGMLGVLVLVGSQEGSFGDTLAPSLATARRIDRALPVLVYGVGLGALDIVRAYHLGVTDVLVDAPESREVLNGLVRRRASRTQGHLFEPRPGMPRFIGGAGGMREVARLVERVAASEATVLILGESGTGKELVARAVHVLSPRSKGPFVAINCAAIPETLLENELFGHEKGAYTGANSTAIGKVEAAEKGTLFLDEIGEMPLPLQSKILRLLQDHTYDRIGGNRTRKADVRIVTATNRDLKLEVGARRFREDLYYRLSVVPVTLPALRERPADIPLLAEAILERIARDLSRPGLRLAPAALDRLVAYRWPGNVRELENELERAAVLVAGDEIGPFDLELRPRAEDPDLAALSRLVSLELPLAETVAAAAHRAGSLRTAKALEDAGGDREKAAAELGISLAELEERVSG